MELEVTSSPTLAFLLLHLAGILNDNNQSVVWSVQGKAITFLAARISSNNFPQKERKFKFSTFRDKRA